MQQYLQKLRSKPEETRKQILIWTLVLCMSLVVLIWVSSLGHNSKTKTQKEASVSEEADESIKPFTMLKASVKDAYNDVYSSVGEINLQMKEEVKVEEPEKQVDLIPIEE